MGADGIAAGMSRRLRFFLRCGPGQELPVLLAGTSSTGERVVVDPVKLDPSGLTTLDAWRPSWSGELLAYQTSVRGSEIPTLRVLDVATGGEVNRPVYPGRVTPVAWRPDDTGFYYVTCPTDGPRHVRRHLLGEHPSRDSVVFSTNFRQLSVSISPSGRWVAVSCAPGAQRGNMVYLADLSARPSHPLQLHLVYDSTTSDAQALLKFGPGDLLYVITTNQAPGGQVCTIDPATPNAENWTPVITADEGAVDEGAVNEDAVLSGCVVLTEPTTNDIRFLVSSSKSGISRLSLHDQDGGLIAHVPAPRTGPGTIMKLTAPPGQATQAWFACTTSLPPPRSTGSVCQTGKATPRPRQNTVSNP
jgi:prolyl oligopeptidase